MTGILFLLGYTWIPKTEADEVIEEHINELQDHKVDKDTLPLNVKDYDAKGDGITNDSAAIQAAIDALAAGGYIYFPQGIYRARDVHITKSLTLLGAKGASFRAYRHDAGGGNYQSYNIFYADTVDAVGKIEIINLEFDGLSNWTGAGTHREPLIKLQTVTNVVIRDCFFHNHSGSSTGLLIDSDRYDLPAVSIWYSTNVTVKDCTFKDNYTEQLWVQGSIATFPDIKIENNKWLRGTQGASPLTVIRCTGVISDNFMDYFKASGMNVLGCKGMTVKSNRFIDGTTSWAIDLVDGGIYEANNVVVEDNYIEECAYGIAGWGDNIVIRNNTLNGITNNLRGIMCTGGPHVNAADFYSVAEIAADLVPIARDYYGLIIEGNTIKDIHEVAASGNETYAIGVGNAIANYYYRDVEIKDNLVYQTIGGRVLEVGIFLTNVKNTWIKNNSLYDFTHYGIYQSSRVGTTGGIGLLEIINNFLENSDADNHVIYIHPLDGGGIVKVKENYFSSQPAATKYKLWADHTVGLHLHFIDNIGAEQSDFDYEDDDDNAEIVYENVVPFMAASPTSDLWVRGDTIKNTAPATGGSPGWVCVRSENSPANGGEPAAEVDIAVDDDQNAAIGDIVGFQLDDDSWHWSSASNVVGNVITINDGIPAGRNLPDNNVVYWYCFKAMANLA